jgi:hypothetical protein
VFIDETWTKTNMEPNAIGRRRAAARPVDKASERDRPQALRGWAPRGERLVAKVPHGHWKTMTFVTSLRYDRIEAAGSRAIQCSRWTIMSLIIENPP